MCVRVRYMYTIYEKFPYIRAATTDHQRTAPDERIYVGIARAARKDPDSRKDDETVTLAFPFRREW